MAGKIGKYVFAQDISNWESNIELLTYFLSGEWSHKTGIGSNRAKSKCHIKNLAAFMYTKVLFFMNVGLSANLQIAFK